MTKNTSFKQKIKAKFSFKPKYLVIFFVVCIAFLVILATIVRATQQQLIKISNENAQHIEAISLQLQQLQRQQNQYQRWWENERSNKIQNNLYDILYKIKLANLYFKLGENFQARQLLENAESILTTLDNKQTDPLKQKITDTIEYLSTLAQVNINKTILTLDKINETIETLPVLNEYDLQENTQTVQQQSEKKPTQIVHSNRWWNPILKQLKQLVIIHRTKADEGIFFKENALLIKQMVIQKILQAQQALLKNDFALYQQNINVAITWLKEYFSKDKVQLQAIIQTLTDLNAYRITPPKQSIDFFTLIATSEKMIRQLNINVTAKKNQSTSPKHLSNKTTSSTPVVTLPLKPVIEV